jgi:hypothetical protein
MALVQMANDLLVMDITDQGNPGERYPISICARGPEGQAWSWLVYPLEEWNGWDVETENAHCVPRSLLLEQGRDGFIICRELNAIFSGEQVVVTSAAHKHLLEKLYADLGVRFAYTVVVLANWLADADSGSVTVDIEMLNQQHPHSNKSGLIFDLLESHLKLQLF